MKDRPSRRTFLRAAAGASCSVPALVRMSVDAAAYFEQGREQLRRGELEVALVSVSKAIDLEPTDEEALDLRSIIYESLNDYKRAIADRSTIIRLNPSTHNFLMRGIFALGHDPALAIADFGEVIRGEPLNADAFFHRAVAYEEQRNYALAQADYSMSARLDPENAEWVAEDIARAERLRGKG